MESERNKVTEDIGTGKPGPGRPKGSVNKVTADVRRMVIKALKLKGGVAYLAKQADENPVAFMSLLAKTMPKDVKVAGDEDNPLRIIQRLEVVGVLAKPE